MCNEKPGTDIEAQTQMTAGLRILCVTTMALVNAYSIRADVSIAKHVKSHCLGHDSTAIIPAVKGFTGKVLSVYEFHGYTLSP